MTTLLGVVLKQDADTKLLGSAPGAVQQGGRATLDRGGQLPVGQVAALVDEDGPVRGLAGLPGEGGVDALRGGATPGRDRRMRWYQGRAVLERSGCIWGREGK